MNALLLLLKKLALLLGTVSVTTFAGTTPSLTPVTITCPSSWQEVLYDTPTGELTSDYFVKGGWKSSTTTQTEAHVLGVVSKSNCHDANNKSYITTISNASYASLATSTEVPTMTVPQSALTPI